MTQENEAAGQRPPAPSLREINGTVALPRKAGFWKMLAAYSGPGCLVAVGYMDPGNWITSIQGGAQYAYSLLCVILVSSLTAMLLQGMAVRLGIATGMDLAQATRAAVPKPAAVVLWVMAELAIMATDIAEVIGGAVALSLLFGLPLTAGVLVTVGDVFLLLMLMRAGFRKVEALVAALITAVLAVFVYEVAAGRPDFAALAAGFIPTPAVAADRGSLLLALGIVGATVMPHNLYLHSSIVQARSYPRTAAGRREAIRFATLDSNIQLGIAFLVNCLLLVLGASMFYGHAGGLGRFADLYRALSDPAVAGAAASPVLATLFALALLASGQNSTITGTLAGQVVMEGFLGLRLPQWLRRLVTRLLSVAPVLACTVAYGGREAALEHLLVLTQVFLSLQLPFTVVPLTLFTGSKRRMGAFVNPRWKQYLAWGCAAVLCALNVLLLWNTFTA